jgi:eukaryotic-like serine/threonine-protein kinase
LTPERWAQIEELFHLAAESDPQHRTAVLDEACGNDSELREQVEALLSSDHSARSKMQAAVRSEFESVVFSLTGTTVSHYRILGGVGGGGMGLVYRAEDTKLGRLVAIKFLPEESAKDPAALQRFEREARSASALEHPNICPIYEFGEHEGQLFLVMQLLEGQTLRELIASAEFGEPPFNIHRLIDVAIQISDGLNAAHSHGIIHRDIKPANIFVTIQGEVKILDFGLAKLAHTDAEPVESENNKSDQPVDLFLSRTGMALGTAAYMSPEQIRGEKLDARADLFSFGLVLYEMATGQRAVTGETGPELQHAVLNEIPVSPRRLNRDLPPRFERIILKLLEKRREARHQSASELRTELQKLRARMDPRRALWLAMGAGSIVLVIAISSFWFIRRQSVLPMPELKLRQLTANSPENHVSGGMISPDGKYLAYSDSKGLRLKVIDTGDTRVIPKPKELEGQNFEWKCGAWSPDSSRFLANSIPAGKNIGEIGDDDMTTWSVPVGSEIPQKLRAGAFAWSFSPDGSLIAFGTNNGSHGPREIWLMDASGEHARKLLESGDEDTINTASWSADGQRMIYVRERGAGVKLYSQDLTGGPPTLLERPSEIKDKKIDFGITLPDGRSIFSVTEEGTIGTATCNFWTVQNDLRTGEVIVKPRRITNWAGFCMDPTSVTADGKKLVFLQMAGHPTIHVADLQGNGTRISNERHLTLTESMDVVADWTPDSRSIIFWSNRTSQAGIYKQTLDEDTPKLLMTTQQDLNICCVTPDGHWFIYMLSAKPSRPGATGDLMRIPIAGGAQQKLFSVRNVSWWGCARSPSDLCAIAERSDGDKEVIITSFDPEKGRGAELTRIAVDPNVSDWTIALSADGKRFAVIQGPQMPLQILSLKGEVIQTIKIPEWSKSSAIEWAADGKALFVPLVSPGGAELVHINLRGEIHLIRENFGKDYTAGVPSPDGRHLAIETTADNKNVWMMEDF